MNLSRALTSLIAGEDLSRDEVRLLFGQLMDGAFSEVQKTALLVAMSCKQETAPEIAGAAAAMRERFVAIEHGRRDVVDTCGTGGDGRGTFNVSTAAAVIAAAGAVPVAKHGNRSVSSRSGSADVLAALGLPLELPPEVIARCLDEVGLAFLFAPLLHPAMREVMPIRRELGVRTVFNVLGPLTNPAGARRQVMGVFSASLVETVGEVLRDLGAEHALVVHGLDGLDEITTTGPTRVAEVRGGAVVVFEIEPHDLGLPVRRVADLAGGQPEDNAAALRRLLAGEKGPLLEISAANAGAALYVGGATATLREGTERALELVASGAAERKLQELLQWTQKNSANGSARQADIAEPGG